MRLTFITALALTANAAFAQTGKIVFKGTADTAYNGQIIMMYNNALHVLDSAKVEGGKFELATPFTEASRYFFYSKFEAKKKHGYSPYGIVVTKPSEVTFKADMETLANSVIGNAPENDLYNGYAKVSNEANQQLMQKVIQKFGADYGKHLNEKDPLNAQINAFYDELAKPVQAAEKVRLAAFVNQHPSSFSAMMLLSNSFNSLTTEEAEKLYNKLGPAYKQSRYGTRITDGIAAARLTVIGKPAPEFAQPDTAGKMVKLSDFKGKYVLLDFWASWCGPCRAENPNVVKAYQKYKDKGFTVLGVSLDRPNDKAAWLKAIKADHLEWTQVSDLKFFDNTVAKLYGINAIPQNYLVSPDGKIIASSLRGEELDKKLAELLN